MPAAAYQGASGGHTLIFGKRKRALARVPLPMGLLVYEDNHSQPQSFKESIKSESGVIAVNRFAER